MPRAAVFVERNKIGEMKGGGESKRTEKTHTQVKQEQTEKDI